MLNRYLFLQFFVVASLQLAGPAWGDPAALADFCGRAQQVAATTSIVPQLEIHDDYETFVKSKAISTPLIVQQYASNPLPGEQGIPRVLSCKMKTAERINAAHATENVPQVALGDTSCQRVHQEMLVQVLAKIPPGEQVLGSEELVIDEEELTFIGPMWLRPWPFEPLYRGDDGSLHLRSRALYVPFAWWIPMPDRFKGTYYCHLISPDYLEALVRGEPPTGL